MRTHGLPLLLKRIFHVSFHCLYHRVTELGLAKPVDRAVFINQIQRQLGINGKAAIEELEPDPLDPKALYRSTRFSRLIRSAYLQDKSFSADQLRQETVERMYGRVSPQELPPTNDMTTILTSAGLSKALS